MQTRENAADTDFEGILEEEVAADLKEIATISMGTEISAEDMSNITSLCDQVGCSSLHCHTSSQLCCVFSSNGDMWAVCPCASELAQQLGKVLATCVHEPDWMPYSAAAGDPARRSTGRSCTST